MQHRVERTGRLRRRDLAAQVRDADAQDRVGQQADPAELEQDRRMAEPGGPAAAHGSSSPPRASRSSDCSASVRAASAEKNATSSPIPTST